MKKLSIGMPVYNGEKYVEEALTSLLNQSYDEWDLCISDNNSIDNTRIICEKFCKYDSRISYIRQDQNLGAIENYKYLLEKSVSPYFMWAACDDLWHKDFIEVCIEGLESSENIGLAFSNIVNIDSYGREIREYPSFKRFVNSDPTLRIVSFLLDPEYMGKANLIYGIFKQKSIKRSLLESLSRSNENDWGIDMALVLRILCDTNLYIDERILFHKRIVRDIDSKSAFKYIDKVERQYVIHLLNKKQFSSYKRVIMESCQDTSFAPLINYLIQYREKLNNQTYEEIALLKNGSCIERSIFASIKRIISQRYLGSSK